ncbi:cytochrome p450 domain-containing protein [Ditylenchus destructor]|uniref:Cytochrome p450 domain-containing protein n=1 Tax=Ditylenchus destructor TaxID=166010 RepID=A0AAD4MVK5_9BILA|nr:cytochrome p450 domain-containing protein [Ditylenchus destructor]
MLNFLIGIIIIVLTSIIIIYAAACYNVGYWRRYGINGPIGKPFVGSLGEWWGGSSVFKLREWTKQYGKVYGIQEGWRHVLIVSDIDMLQELFVKKFEYFHGRKINPLVGNVDNESRVHVFNARGARWKRLRAVANPVFSVTNLKKIMPILEDSVRVMMGFLDEAYEKGKSFNIHPYFHELAMDIISRIAMGQQGSLQFRSKNAVVAKQVFERFGKTWIDYYAWTLPFLAPLLIKFAKLTGKIRGEPMFNFLRTIEQEVKNRKKQKDAGVQRNGENVDFIDLFLEVEGEVDQDDGDKAFHRASAKISKKLTIDEIVAQCFVFLLAGFDTTANTLANTCFLLAHNSEAQQRLQQEIDDICPEGDPTYEQLNQLKYAEATMKEALRLHPIAAFACSRTCSETTTLGNYTIEAGTLVQADVLTVQHDKEIWGENADEFRPERWLEESDTSHLMAWFPFGAGPRTCIGLRLAYMEEKLALLHILRKYNIVRTTETEKELKMVGSTILNPESVTVKLELRSSS